MRVLRGLVAATLLVGLVLCLPARADAAGDLAIRKIDTTKFPTVKLSVLVTGDNPDLGDFALRENGKIVGDFEVVPIGETATPVGIVLVIDTSGSMRPGGKLEQAKAAARRFIDEKQPNDQIAVVAFSNEPRVVSNFTNDAALLRSSIDSLQPSGETALWDAVRVAASLLTEQATFLPYMVVLSDGADTVSSSSADEALGAADTANAGVFAGGLLGGGEFDSVALRRLADATGGLYDETSDARQLDRLYQAVQRVLQNQYEVTWQSNVSGSLEVTLLAGGASANATTVAGSVATGRAPRPVEAPSAPGPLGEAGGKGFVAVLAAIAAVAVAGAVRAIARNEKPLSETLRPYATDAGVTVEAPARARDRSIVQTAVLRRAVEATARVAAGRGLIQPLERRLEQADIRLRAQEALFFYIVSVVLVALASLVAAGPALGTAILLVFTVAPIAFLNAKAERRRRTFANQLPDTLQLLASSLRAGYSLMQGLEAVAKEVDEPMGRELRRVVVESSLGRPLEIALDDTSRRMASADFEWAVMAIGIQREVGGNLAELLTTVSETMIARERMRREVRALTAEGRFSAIILGAMPVAIGGILFVLNPTYLLPLFREPLGKVMVLGSVVLAAAGFLWMKKIIEIEL